MAPIIEEITEVGCFQLGEAPHWDIMTQSLYFVDVAGKSINKYVPSTKKHTQVVFDKPTSFIIPIKGSSDRFVISLERDICVITWDGVSSKVSHIETIASVDTDPEGVHNVLNDGKVDAFGNLWTGTMSTKADIETFSPKVGNTYSLTKRTLKKHLSGISVSNGLAWSKDSKKFYYIDTGKQLVDQFDYDHISLTISNCQPLFTLEKHGLFGLPDGQTIDEEGNLWVALFRGNKVIRISTEKPETLLNNIDLPESLLTSVCFGGENLDELYVTSCNIPKFEDGVAKPLKGALYKITGLGVRGLPAEEFIFT